MRLPLFYPLESRDGTLAKDAKLKNAMAELGEEGLLITKRPGTLQIAGALELGTLIGQGIVGFGPNSGAQSNRLYAVFGDHLYKYTPDPGTGDPELADIIDLSTGSSISWGAGTAYGAGNVGDPVFFINEETGAPEIWYVVAPSTGKKPKYISSSYAYWSRYPDKPVGTHPAVSYVFGGYSGTIDGGTCTGTITSSVRVLVDILTFVTISGSVASVGPCSHFLATYTDYYNSGLLMNGFSNNYVPNLSPTYSNITDHPAYLSAADYARSVLY